jgi:hypothetical protein
MTRSTTSSVAIDGISGCRHRKRAVDDAVLENGPNVVLLEEAVDEPDRIGCGVGTERDLHAS